MGLAEMERPRSGHGNNGRWAPGSRVTLPHDEPLSPSGLEDSVGLGSVRPISSELPEKGVHPASPSLLDPHDLGTLRGAV